MRRKDDDDRKSYDEVFDKENLLRIYKLFTDGVIDTLDFPISTGKEGNVFRATTPDGTLVAVKIYRTRTATFRDMAKYIQGDPRFKGVTTNKRKLRLAWAAKEYANLLRFAEAGVRVPRVIARNDNIIVMEYIGTEESPAAEMRHVALENPGEVSRTIMEYVKLAYQKAELVHGDLSEFNVLMDGQEPVIIDVAQGVILKHPLAEDLLERDVNNMARFFRKYGVSIDTKAVLGEIRKR